MFQVVVNPRFKLMKKNLLLLIILILCQYNLKAQWVTIPDSNFVNKLTQLFPSCMNGNQMDTTCWEIENTTRLSIQWLNIADLTGIQYFDNLNYLRCENNALNIMPNLPNTLDSLLCGYNQLTSLPTLPNAMLFLDCNNNQLTSLPFLPATLRVLYCNKNSIANLPSLPNLLLSLNCGNNQLNNLPVLPNSLASLDCRFNQLTNLPTIPSSLDWIVCSNNQLTSLPTLPSYMDGLICNNNQLTSLPALPISWWQAGGLNCDNNLLTSLPVLPSTLPSLSCSNNLLTSLPSLPNNLFSLYCNNNLLTSLPTLPNNLHRLECGNNQLTTLPLLPSGLNALICHSNQLIYMPSLPTSIDELVCSNNLLTSFPTTPNYMSEFKINNNNILCLTKLPLLYSNSFSTDGNIANNPLTCVPNLTSYSLGLPLCSNNDSVNNPNNCPGVNITGKVYTDLDNNCAYYNNDLLANNIPIKLFDNQNNFLELGYTVNGVYSFNSLLPDTFQVKLDDMALPIYMDCGQANTQNVSLDSINQTIVNINFPVACDSIYDLSIQSVSHQDWAFPGMFHRLYTNITNNVSWYNLNCNSSAFIGTVTIEVTGPVTYVSPAYNALIPQISNNTFTYNITNFNNLTFSSFGLVLLTDTSAQANDTICVHVEISTIPNDANITNNVYDFCYIVMNSYDPNYKEVYPVDVLPGYDDWYTYTIHFQNTGSAPAINIQLRDTLDSQLDINTFEYLGASHSPIISVNSDLLTVRFNNIMLPDSMSNYLGSMGYFQYRIKPFTNLPSGTQIENTAYIYFDYNAPIITNTTQNNYYCFPVNYPNVFTFCSEDSVQYGGNWYSSPIVFADTFSSAFGCDSIVLTIINQIDVDTSLATIGDTLFANTNYSNYEWINCANDSTIQNSANNSLTIPFTGIYKVKITSNEGCIKMSSCISVTKVCQEINTQQSFNICSGDSVNVGNNWYVNTGTFTDTLLTVIGCDSVITTNVNETFIDTLLIISGDTIFANPGYSNYIWLNCSTGDTLTSSSSNMFIAPNSGLFSALISTNNSCSAATSCVPLIVTEEKSIVKMTSEFILFPNPSSDIFNFKDTKNLKQVEVFNLLGEQIITQGNQKQINLSSFVKGIYYARINGEVVLKLVKE